MNYDSRYPPQKAEQPLKKLTPREAEVYSVLIRGKTDKEIAAELNLGTRTIRFHVSNILRKFSVMRRIELLAMAAEVHEDSSWPRSA